MFRFTDDDLVSGLKQWACITLGHYVYGFGGTPRPDDVFPAFGIDQTSNLIACRFVARG